MTTANPIETLRMVADASGLAAHIRQFDAALPPELRREADVIMEIMRGYIHEQFAPGGDPYTFNTGNRLRDHGGSLIESFRPGKPGNIFEIRIDASGLHVSLGTSHPGAAIHEFGGFIRSQGSMENYFWAQYLETRLPFFRILAISVAQKGGITIKARPFMGRAEAALATEGLDRIAIELLQLITLIWGRYAEA